MGIADKLQSARKKMGLSVEKASDETKLSIDKIKALENEDYSAFASDFYARCFLKLYADFLGVKVDARKEIGENFSNGNTFISMDKIRNSKKKSAIKISKITIAVAALAVLAYFTMHYFLVIRPFNTSEIVEVKENEIPPRPELIELKAVVSEPAWIRVVPDDGRAIETLLTPPATEYFRADEQLKIRIGNIWGIDMYYRNNPALDFKQVDIETGQRGGVNELEFTKEFSE
ncbi:MAG: helix-turn-helix domain-containing protein [Elusimicrobiota bacterium]